MSPTTLITEIETPALLLDRDLLQRNTSHMRAHLQQLGVSLRPHVKTAKSIEVVSLATAGQPAGITVSTLREAEYFFEHGITDILYAVGIVAGKLARAAALIRRGVRQTVILDSLAAAHQLIEGAERERVVFCALIELDVDGHRAGVTPQSSLLIDIGTLLSRSPGVQFLGVMTHAGDSYSCRSQEAIANMAEQERAGSVRAAERLRAAGIPVSVVSVGSTPTATFARDLSGITEVRVGVYMFQDLVMAGLGVCNVEDIALSVLVAVIGHQREKGWIITDGGWMSLSRDRGTSSQPVDQGYGLVRSVTGDPLPDDLIVISANQEHGIIARRDGKPVAADSYPVGSKLRVLPNHACATAAQHGAYQVVAGRSPQVITTWERINGW
jgi:D-serine deaminase-like pyridoxal phosphate-dependent protein